MSSPRPVVIDTDPGIDDAQAIAMMLSAEGRGELQVVGITTVAGNCSLQHATRNARRILAIFGRLDIPLFAGAHCSLVTGTTEPENDRFHGYNGLGDAEFAEPLPEARERPEHAVSALVRLAREHKGELDVLALGPLTNLAMAARMDADFVHNVRDFYIMGGNYCGIGNVTSSSEFNFFTDPEAAQILLSSVQRPVVVSCWEVCVSHGIDLGWREKTLGSVDTPAARFFDTVERPSLDRRGFVGKTPGTYRWITCDQMAAAVLIRPQIVLKQTLHQATVELQGEYTRGQMVVDRHGVHSTQAVDDSVKNILLVEELDMELYQEMLRDAFGHTDVKF